MISESNFPAFSTFSDMPKIFFAIIEKIIQENFDLSPRGIREMLKLNNPIYEITSAYGHFGRKPTNKGEFSWEKTDKAETLREAAGT